VSVLVFAVFMDALDQTFVLTVMPSIMRSLYVPYTRLDDAGWIITGYLLGYIAALPLFGRLADVRGRRIIYVASLVLVAAASALCILTPRLDLFIGSRVMMAAGGAAVICVAMATGAELFPERRRALVLGIIGAAVEAGGVVGPIYGVALASLWNWRMIFVFNIVETIALAAFTTHLIPRRAMYRESQQEAPDESRRRRAPTGLLGRLQTSEVDYIGAALLGLVLAGLAIGLVGNRELDQSPVKWPWLVMGGVALVAFILHERRQEHPLIRLEFFRRAPFTAANIANFLVGGALIIALVEVPLHAYSFLNMTEAQAGLLLVRLTVMIPVGAVIGGWLADKIGYRIVALFGFMTSCAGFLLVTRWGVDPSGLVLTRDLMVIGFGFGLVIAPINATVTTSVGPLWMATGVAFVTVTRTMGNSIGLSWISSWGLRRFADLTSELELPLQTPGVSDAEYQKLVDAYSHAVESALRMVYADFFLVAAVVMGLALIPAMFFYRRRGGLSWWRRRMDSSHDRGPGSGSNTRFSYRK